MNILYFLSYFTDRVALELLNENWPSMYKYMISESREIWEPVLMRAANNFLSRVPADKLLY